VHLAITTIWSAEAERSGDGAFVNAFRPGDSKAASRFACRRTPYIPQWMLLVVLARCARGESTLRNPVDGRHYRVHSFPKREGAQPVRGKGSAHPQPKIERTNILSA
jgi:hypothetical protein